MGACRTIDVTFFRSYFGSTWVFNVTGSVMDDVNLLVSLKLNSQPVAQKPSFDHPLTGIYE